VCVHGETTLSLSVDSGGSLNSQWIAVTHDSTEVWPSPAIGAISATEAQPQQELAFGPAASDAPLCSECGGLMTRNGSCYKCENCGGTSGCS